MPVRLDQLPLRQPSRIASIDWSALDPEAARRLRELGFDDGVAIEALHRSAFRGPIACQVGRMIIALRRAQAAAVMVEPA
ncbi:ferrous iron transport protein A [Sphingomonas sp. MMS24-J13]|uniref:FeoA family protein n=1 Tax=Sphingomonas sp. MMS24-J13 TaxID=3238686 RepID=UPI00384C948E